MDALDPRHGTLAGYGAHRSAKEPACEPCRAAKAEDMRQRRGRDIANPEDSRHGTRAGAVAHQRQGVPECGPCADARREYTNRLAKPVMCSDCGIRRTRRPERICRPCDEDRAYAGLGLTGGRWVVRRGIKHYVIDQPTTEETAA